MESSKPLKKTPKNVSNKYYNIPEEEIQEIILRAKEGSQKDQLELLKIFDNFLSKYCSLLYRGKYDLRDYDVRRFISLFIPDKIVRIRLIRNQLNSATYKSVTKTMNRINGMVRRYCDQLDVRQTVQMTFLQCVERYERRGSIPFSGFLYSYFFYWLKKHVDQFMIYQLGLHTYPLNTDDAPSSSESGENRVQQTVIPQTISLEELVLNGGQVEYDEYWVLGDTTMFPFDRLTVQQRQLVKWRYVDGLKASQIALRTTEHPNTCRAQLQSVKDEIAQILKLELL